MTNFVLQELVDTKRASGAQTAAESCEVCSTDEQFVRATVFCVDCSQRLCDRCSLPHKRWKGGAHHVRPLGTKLSGKLSLLTSVVIYVQSLEINCEVRFVFGYVCV